VRRWHCGRCPAPVAPPPSSALDTRRTGVSVEREEKWSRPGGGGLCGGEQVK
jgi:hypothetical protein